jgi:carbon-monoxide dehydrogenase small subunit
MLKTISLTVNGKPCSGEVEPRTLLAHFLRDTLRLTGTHLGCVVGRCGACTVMWNGTPVKSCMVFAVQASGDEIITVEGLAEDKRLHPLHGLSQHRSGHQRDGRQLPRIRKLYGQHPKRYSH